MSSNNHEQKNINQEQSTKKTKKKLIIIFSVLVFLLVVIFSSAFVLINKDDNFKEDFKEEQATLEKDFLELNTNQKVDAVLKDLENSFESLDQELEYDLTMVDDATLGIN